MRKLLLILLIAFANNGLVIASPLEDAKAAVEKEAREQEEFRLRLERELEEVKNEK